MNFLSIERNFYQNGKSRLVESGRFRAGRPVSDRDPKDSALQDNNENETFDAFRVRLRSRYESLSPHLQRLARLALEDPNVFALETITQIASRASVQPSTLVRFAKEFGFSGFSPLQKVFRLRLIEGEPSLRQRAYRDRKRLGRTAFADPVAVLAEFADVSMASLAQLKQTARAEDLSHALMMLSDADHIYVIGQRRAFPIAAYIAYGLTRLELRCTFLDFVGGMVPQQAATMRARDLLFAVAFAEYTPAVVDIVQDVHLRGVPVLTITDVPASPLARYSSLSFLVDEMDTHQFRPIAGAVCLVQTLMIALGAARDRADDSAPPPSRLAEQS
jgi:DNA-binding MurR/RpiR family transcriptional regulator